MNTDIKLCQIITQTHFGGAQKYICDIVNHLSDDFDITIAYGDGEETELSSHIHKNVKFIKLKRLQRSINPFQDILAIFELFLFFKKNHFNVIHLHSSKAGFIGSISGKLAGISKIIYTAHGWVFKEDLSFLKKSIYILLEKIAAKFKTKIICVSKQDYDLAISKHIAPKNKLELIYNGINNINFIEKDGARKILFEKFKIEDTGQKLIGTIANFYKNKGLKYFIEAADILNKKNNNTIFFIIGDGIERKNLEELIIKNNLKNFFLLGYIKEDANTLLRAFDIFVLASIKEGLPYTLLESLNASNLIVSSNLESLTEIIENNVNGVIFEAKNSNDLASKIDLLLTNKELALKLTENSSLSLEKFDFQNFINKIKENYSS